MRGGPIAFFFGSGLASQMTFLVALDQQQPYHITDEQLMNPESIPKILFDLSLLLAARSQHLRKQTQATRTYQKPR